MKKTLLLIAAVFTLTGLAYSQPKLGVINAQEVFQKSQRGAEIQNELESLQKGKQAEMQMKTDAVKKLEKEVMSPALNNETREKKKIELQNRRQDLKRFIEDAQREIQRESQKRLVEMEKELMPLINSYAKANGFTVIYDISRSGIVFYDKAIDITGALIKIYDAQTADE